MISVLQEDYQELDLVRMARSGDSNAFEVLLKRYQWLVRTRARRYFLQGAEYEDLVQEGVIGLFKAVRDYREEGGLFRPFADICITRQLITAVKTASRLKHLPLNSARSLEAPIYNDRDSRLLKETIQTSDSTFDTSLLEEDEARIVLGITKKYLSNFEFKILLLWLEGLPYAQIARRCRRREKSVDNGLWRVKCKIRRLLTRGIFSAVG